ncbi:hypothetical protein [Virgibacillus sp. Bac332]|uniref:hypothetical protein n=1 Tax=Virgibacillus sp. Bac332 TaxID=2419842 RepID=UPI000EF4AAA8|nr:hypothetical protein [Virgibacillus sp. Bac332]
MAELTVQSANINGIAPTFANADASGDTFTNYGNSLLHVDNQDAADKQVTIASNPCNFGEVHNLVISVPAGETRIIGKFNRQRFNDDAMKVNISYDDVTSLSVAVIKY